MNKTLAKPQKSTTFTDLKALVPFMATEKKLLLWTIAVDLLANLSLIALSTITAYLVGTAVIYEKLASWQWWTAGIVLALLRPLLTWHEMDISHSVAYRVLAALRMALFHGFSRGIPSPRGIHSGQLASTVMTDIEKLEFFYAHTVAQLVAASVLTALALPLLWSIAPLLAVAFILGCILLYLTSLPLMHRGNSLGQEQQKKFTDLSEKTVDVLAGTREILVFHRVENAIAEVSESGQKLDHVTRKVRLNTAYGTALRESVVILTSLALAVIAFRYNDINPVWVPSLLAGTLTLMAPLAEAVAVIANVQPLRSSARRVAEGISLGHNQQQTNINSVSKDYELAVHLKDVHYAYPGREPLDLPDLSIKRGEHVGLAGPSGTGKSTLAKLLAGLWATQQGTIEVCGKPVSAYLPSELTHTVQLVEQETPLFYGTLAENLRLGAEKISDQLLEQTLESVGLPVGSSDFPLTLDSFLSEGGGSISGGQRARLGLARALVRCPAVLILDETTAALDAHNESAVMDVVNQLECAVLVISHREQTLKHLSRIVRWKE